MGDGGPATGARLLRPAAVAVDPLGVIYISDTGNHRVRRVAPDGTITTIAGNGQEGFSGDGGSAAQASLISPGGLAWSAGVLYIADSGNGRVRAVDAAGTIRAVAGGGTRSLLMVC